MSSVIADLSQLDFAKSLKIFPACVYLKDSNGKFLFMNKHCADHLQLGRPFAPTDNYTDYDFFKKECADEWRLSENSVMQGSCIVNQTEMEEWLTGRVSWSCTTKVPLYGAKQQIVGVLGVTSDVTEETRRLGQLKAAFDGSTDGLWYRDLDTTEVTFSPRWKEMLGYDDDEVPNDINELWNRIHPEDRALVRRTFENYVSGATTHYECEFRLKTKSKSYLWILSRGRLSKHGCSKYFAGSHTDITKTKQSADFLETLLNTLPTLIFVKDKKYEFTFANKATVDSYCPAGKSIVGLKDGDLNKNKKQVAQFEEADRRVLEKKESIEISREDLTFVDGTTHVLATRKVPLRSRLTDEIQVLGVSTDVTDLTTKEQLTEAILGVLLQAIHGIENSKDENEACEFAVICLGGLQFECMISFLQANNGVQALVAAPAYASTAKWKLIADNTVRDFDAPPHARDLIVEVLRTKAAIFVEDSRVHQLCDNVLSTRAGLVSQYAVPLATDQLEIGCLQVDMGDRKEKPLEYCTMIDALAAHLSLAIDRHRTRIRLDALNSFLLQQRQVIAFEIAAARIIHQLNHSLSDYLGILIEARENTELSANKAAVLFLKRTERFVTEWRSAVKDNLNEFKRGEARKAHLLSEIVNDVVGLWQHKAGAKKCKLRSVSGTEGLRITGSLGAIKEMLGCLIVNAIDANARSISISVERVSSQIGKEMRSYAEICVEDDGDGVPLELVKDLTRFGWTTKGSTGHGIGLALVDLLAQEMGGTFRLVSAGRGGGASRTIFAVRLPETK